MAKGPVYTYARFLSHTSMSGAAQADVPFQRGWQTRLNGI